MMKPRRTSAENAGAGRIDARDDHALHRLGHFQPADKAAVERPHGQAQRQLGDRLGGPSAAPSVYRILRVRIVAHRALGELDRNRHPAGVALDAQARDGAGLARRDVANQLLVGADVAAFDVDDHVVGAHAGPFRRRSGRDVLHQRAARRAQRQRTLERRRDVGQQHPHVAARHAAPRLELRKNRHRLVDRHGETDVAGPRADRGVDADDLTASVDERSAAVPEVDGGVGLDVIVQARVEELAADEADHADGHRVHVPERVADGAHPLAHTELVGVPERRLRQIAAARNPHQRHVDGRIAADDLRPERPAVRERHGDALGGVDDVMVRQDVAVAIDQEAAAGPLPRRLEVARARALHRSLAPAKVALRLTRLGRLRRRIDVDDGRVDPLGHVREVHHHRRAHEPGRLGQVRTRAEPLRRRHVRLRREPAGDDQADEKRHGSGECDGDEREAFGHGWDCGLSSQVSGLRSRSPVWRLGSFVLGLGTRVRGNTTAPESRDT